MRRRVAGYGAVVAGAACLALGVVALGLFAGLSVQPVASQAAGTRSQAFVAGLFFVGMGAYLVRSGRNFARVSGERAGAPSRPAEAPPVPEPEVAPVPVPPEEAELVDGPVVGCLRCGATRMRPLTLADGLFFGGDTLAWVCGRCGWRGAPLHFDSPTSYRAFVKGLHEEQASARRVVMERP